MIKRVEINLVPSRYGLLNLKRGFHVQIQIIDESNPLAIQKLSTSLPSAIKVNCCYQKWKKLHKDFYESSNFLKNIQNNVILSMICQLPFAIEILDYYEKCHRWLHKYFYELTNDSFGKRPIEVYKLSLYNDVKNLAKKLESKKALDIKSQLNKLKEEINDWLDTKDFCKTEKELRTQLGENDEIMVIISTEDDLAWRLPWHFWSFFNDYINAGVVLSHPEFKKVDSNTNHSSPQEQIKVLAIVDDEDNRKDLNEWKDNKNFELEVLSEQILDSEPLKKISDKLSEQPWDILFFAGHSSSNIKNEKAGFYINKKCYLTINQLKNPLTYAINQGLQLAFFNSCDGLGLARDLLKLNLPKVIVMREDVPNKVAELFLKYFLEEFMANQGSKPTFVVVQKVREKLEVWEYESEINLFPGASLLPVICFNPATDLT
ncbi:hypothetical protein NUACC21_05360 [Scytonema sp. NUACC21]